MKLERIVNAYQKLLHKKWRLVSLSKWTPCILNEKDKNILQAFSNNDALEQYLRQEQQAYDKIVDERDQELGWRMLSIADEIDIQLMKLAKAKDNEAPEIIDNINQLVMAFCHSLKHEDAVKILEIVSKNYGTEVAFLLAQHYINYLLNLL